MSSIIDPHAKTEVKSDLHHSADLTAVIQIKEENAGIWKEITKLTTVSHNGAGFTLTRECPVGRLLALVLKMPREHRVYDLDEQLYPVMGIVQNCYKSTIDGNVMFNIGVGFIGKTVPESFRVDPTQNYRIEGMREDGMWRIAEATKPFKSRRHPRVWQRIPVTLSIRQQDHKTIMKEETFTQNIGISGIAIESTLEANVGDRMKIACKELGFYSLAIVRDRKASEGKPATLHLEFIDAAFPMDTLLDPQARARRSAAASHSQNAR